MGRPARSAGTFGIALDNCRDAAEVAQRRAHAALWAWQQAKEPEKIEAAWRNVVATGEALAEAMHSYQAAANAFVDAYSNRVPNSSITA